jgi:outer membrane protein assembly factor BamD (BamD/ComL family)
MKKMTRRPVAYACVALMILGAQHLCADVPGTLFTTDNRPVTGQIRWRPAGRKYVITMTQGAGTAQRVIETELAPEQVARMQIVKPRGLDEAIQAVRAGNGASVIAALEKISQEYTMLQWDEPATRWLVEAHLQKGAPADAIKAAERIIAANPEAGYKGEMAVAYWNALLKTDRTAKLEGLLADAIKSGKRDAVAFALILRGDLILKRGESKENLEAALRDGYLRVITLFRAVREAQPEALYKGAKALEKLGQTARAGELMDQLRKDFAASEWARKP